MQKIRSTGRSTTGMKKKIADWDEDVGYHANIAEMNG
jgi:hypothetical protein